MYFPWFKSIYSDHSYTSSTQLLVIIIFVFRIAYWIGLWATDPCSNCSHSGFTTVEDCEICREGWIWLDGTPYQFQNWSTYAPGSSHPCATIGDSADKWYDATCTRYQRYICERSGKVINLIDLIDWLYFNV